MSTRTLLANVTDANHRPRGTMHVQVEFDRNLPVEVIHDDQTYRYTGKSGANIKTGLPVREFATADDARLWISHDGSQIWEE